MIQIKDKIKNNFLSFLSTQISLEKNKKINEAIKLSPTLIVAPCDVKREPTSALLFKLEPI